MFLSSIEALLEQAWGAEGNDFYVCEITEVPTKQANLVYEKSGIRIEGFFHTLDNYAVRHVSIRHGDPELEAKYGQIAVQPADFLIIPLIVLEYETLEYEFARNKHTLVFKKTIGERQYVYAAEIRSPKRKRICGQSLRILAIKKAT